jgi:uncharacterized protein (DUF58 family)
MQAWLNRLLHTDFCPSWNRYVYWLKQPVGWFALALAVSLLVGAMLNPLGWKLAAGLLATIAFGMVFPWLAVRFTHCRIEPAADQLRERDASSLKLTVVNRLPLPLWGLMVEDYLTLPSSQSEQLAGYDSRVDAPPEMVLSAIPPFCTATFRIAIQPEYRGRYPQQLPRLSCAFPLNIWTARRAIANCRGIQVWPLRLPVRGIWEQTGMKQADSGQGEATGTTGDFIGVRPFRRGDALRSIHWVQTARTNSLVVCERAGPRQQAVRLELDARAIDAHPLIARENLAWRVRIAAALAEFLHRQHVGFSLAMDGEAPLSLCAGKSLQNVLDQLAAIPLTGHAPFNGNVPLPGTAATGTAATGAAATGAAVTGTGAESRGTSVLRITTATPASAVTGTVTGLGSGLVTEAGSVYQARIEWHPVQGSGAAMQRGGGARPHAMHIDLQQDIAAQLESFLQELHHVAIAA